MKLRLVDAIRKTDALPMYREFLKSQWDSVEQTRAKQWDLLQSLIRHAYDHTPFYKELFDKIGAEPGDIKSFEDFRRLPILTKQIVQENRDRMEPNNKSKFQPRPKASGGSTGKPLTFIISRKAHSACWAYLSRAWNIGGWRPGDRVALLAGGSLVPGGNSLKKNLYVYMNNWRLFSAFETSENDFDRWVEDLRRRDIPFMFAYSATAYLFALHILKRGIQDIKFRTVFTTAEVLFPRYRETIEKAFSCAVYDGLHIVTENAYVEIVDDKGEPVPDGTEGRIISTDLYNYAMPFIRYDVCDLSSMNSAPCDCGRTSPRLMGIQGRTGDYLTLKNGHGVHGCYFTFLLQQYRWVSQYHVVQESADEINIYIKPNGKPAQEDIDAILDTMNRKCEGIKTSVRLTDTMPRTPGGKHVLVVNKTLK